MLSDVYFPRVNGVSSSIRTFARGLEQQGHQVTIVAPAYGDDDEQGEFEILRLSSRRIFFDPEDRLIRASALRRVEDLLATRSFDLIHIHTPFRAHQLGVRLARRTGAPTVETYHTYFEQYAAHYLPWLPAGALRWIARSFSRRLCAEVDHLIVPSSQMVEVLASYGIETPSTILPTGIDLDEFASGDGAAFRHAHAIAPERPTLVTVSRLAQEKNIAFLLEVARVLAHEFPTLLFIIAGEGPDAARLQSRSRELGLEGSVRFFGNLDRRTRLLDCYRAGDVFVFASPTETQGLVLIEAMALGVPIVSTAVMGTATVLERAASARTSAQEVPAFANHVAALLRDPALRREMSAAGPLDAQAWSAPVLMQRAIELYARLADDAARAGPDRVPPRPPFASDSIP
jgi:glycosyltransferase involved in cell wall biosynthesis